MGVSAMTDKTGKRTELPVAPQARDPIYDYLIVGRARGSVGPRAFNRAEIDSLSQHHLTQPQQRRGFQFLS